VLLSGCPAPTKVVQKPVPKAPYVTGQPVAAPAAGRPETKIEIGKEEGLLATRLGDGGVAASNAPVSELDAQATQALLSRAEPLPTLDNKNAPVIRPASAPPPRTGPTEPIAFIAQTGKVIADKPVSPVAEKPPGTVAMVPPQILPVGEVVAESEIRVRFTEPMVPVASVGESKTAPATITPNVAGTWRWLDTRVAMFQAAGKRLPMATLFTITVPAGTKAISGAVLPTDVIETFSTPPVQIVGTYPTVPLRPDSPVLVQFDQNVDDAAIQKFLRVEDLKGKKLAFTAISLEEATKRWAKNPSVEFDKTVLPASYVVVAPTGGWPTGKVARVVLAKKAPSKEGARITLEESGAEFEVAPAFVVNGIECGRTVTPRMSGAACPANSYLHVLFSNPIQPASYRSKKVQIAGEPFFDHEVDGRAVSLETPLKVGGSYSITVGDGIVDAYGQPLVGSRALSFTTTRIEHDPSMTAKTGLYTLDPRFEIPQWVIRTQAISKLSVELYQVTPADYFAYQQFERGKTKTMPGKRIYQQEHAIGARNGAVARIDLRPALTNGVGHVIAIAKAAPAAGVRTKLEDSDRERRAWIQVSKLGLTARFDRESAHIWAHDVTPARFLQPIAGVETSLLIEGRTDAPPAVKSDADGHAVYDLLPQKEPKTVQERNEYPTALVVAKSGADVAFSAIGNRYEKWVRHENTRWYVTDDRFTYKPGEPVYLKGWVRWTHDGVNPDLSLPKSGDSVTWSLTDSRGNRIGTGTASFTQQGGFDITANLPANVNLGGAYFDISTRKDSIRHRISVEEFRTPAYAVSLADDVQYSASRPLVLGETISMSTEAKYYAGGGMAGSPIQWAVRLESARYTPPGWDRYSFTPISKRSERNTWRYGGRSARTTASEEGTLSGASTSAIDIGIAALPLGRPSLLEVDATVTDVDRQRIRASSRPILVHPSTLYVGTRLDPENDQQLQLIVTDIDGAAVPGVAIEVAIEGVLGSERDRDDAEVVDTQSCTLTSATKPVVCSFKRKDWQTSYTSLATIKDPRGRTNVSQFPIPWWSRADQDFSVTADKQSYKPGDVAKLTITSKLQPAAAVVSFARNGVIATKRVAVPEAGTTVDLPIEASYIENIKVVVDRIAGRRYQWRSDKHPISKVPLPEQDDIEIDIPVDVSGARLDMRTRPLQPLVEPGNEASFEVEVIHDDKPVKGAEVALLVVDEAVLALSSRHHEDPLTPFYAKVDDGTTEWNNLRMFDDAGSDLLGQPGFEKFTLDIEGRWGTIGHGSGTGTGYGYGSGRGGMSGRSASMPSVMMGAVKTRKDFRATAVFSPKLETDANGKVRLTVKMPDSLTRYRVVALATANTRFFGKAESNIVAQLKVNARTVAPRFLTVGDTFSVPVVVQNLDTAPRTIDVAVRAANLVAKGPQGKRVVVAGGDRAEVRFDFATQGRGKAVIQTVASSGTFADASNVEIPVYEPATTESFATYGSVLDKPQFEQLKIPTDVFPEVGGIEAEISSTQLQNLTDSYWYLYAYPFECAEQRSSRMIATTAMADILDAFALGTKPTKKEILEQRAYDVKKLSRDQRPDGGWGYFWTMGTDSFVTMQVLTALGLQGEKGVVTQNAASYVTKRFAELMKNLEKQVKSRDIKQTKGEDATNVSLAAAALTALAATGADVTPRAVKLHAAAMALRNYPVDAKARLLAIVAGKPAHKAMREKLLADILSVTHETAAAATVTTAFSTEEERMLLVSNAKTNALALDAILRESPQHALVAKLARGLLDSRRRGRWSSTQENLVVLQAMRRYFDVYEKETPDFTGKLWLGSSAYAEQAFKGRSTGRAMTHASWLDLKPGSTHDISIARVGSATPRSTPEGSAESIDKTGSGRMYWRLGITYAPRATTSLQPLDAGFVVRRTYTAVDSPSDVVQLPDGTWRVKLGARVLVQIEALNTSARHAVALVDNLPAGFEAVNTRLATSERAVVDGGASRWDFTAMRDNRSEAFTMHLPEGSHRFSYTVRATTPGAFIAAPAKAEEMYNPETFGRSSGTTVVVQ